MNDQNTPGTNSPYEPHRDGDAPSDVEHTRQLPDEPYGAPASTPTGGSSYAGYGRPAAQGQGSQGSQGPQGPQSPWDDGPGSGYPGQGGGYPTQHGGYPVTGGGGDRGEDTSRRPRLSGWVWPAVAALALVVGLVGGAIGGVAVDEWRDANSSPGRSADGFAGVDTVSEAPLPADNGSIAAVADQLLPSTVQILADVENRSLGATGSGFFMDRQGHVITNNHVVEDAAKNNGAIKVVARDGKRYDAEVVGRSAVYDLAVLFVKDAPEIEPAALGASQSLRIGEAVVAIGSPLGLSSTVTSGIVSAVDRPVTTGNGDDLASYIDAVQTDAAINPGNSGGPLVNLKGQVVGVNSAIATTGSSLGGESGNIGVGFAIPIEQVRVTADQILKDGEARYPVIGATVTTDESGQGALIDGIEPGSPAAKGGLKAGDVVTAVDERQVTDSPTLIVAIRTHLPGEEITLTVDRDGDQREIAVTLDSKVG
ncbi:S1C family serine protease [Nocardioides donggukensis]|uniref:Trypsin-like peptidase domain-containing protein n=1 Tax=Nocardioides donggukensis TaxID=2774019 RepID=A0A927K424_9ACTN|nr:trypsin-like peptidase domain-containing protein [Nocardioides donggukensis]MBD8870282.1 trypsin-like peptidase domain-containing protein [Nocardioides donggukensis]